MPRRKVGLASGSGEHALGGDRKGHGGAPVVKAAHREPRTRAALSNVMLDAPLHRTVDQIKDWPTGDLYPTFLL
jgi:hypothetical protein